MVIIGKAAATCIMSSHETIDTNMQARVHTWKTNIVVADKAATTTDKCQKPCKLEEIKQAEIHNVKKRTKYTHKGEHDENVQVHQKLSEPHSDKKYCYEVTSKREVEREDLKSKDAQANGAAKLLHTGTTTQEPRRHQNA